MTHLEEVLSRWDENRPVAAYQDFLDGPAAAYWAVPLLRDHGLLTDTDPTWDEVVAAHNTHFAQDTGDPDWIGLTDDGRPYQWSTSNPEATWDWWVIGGRWRGQLWAVPDAPAEQLLHGDPTGDPIHPPVGVDGRRRCDGGPRRLLDFPAMRRAAHRAAEDHWLAWLEVCRTTPPAEPFSHYTHTRATGGPAPVLAYGDQPRVVAAQQAGLVGWNQCPIEEFAGTREDYLTRAQDAAVPGYALITLDRRWIASGQMGWFGFGDDTPTSRATYTRTANTYLDALHPDALVVSLDCHI
ncbi:MAG: hypothetical protein HY241_08780 [Actinobacteria bacterium]|nr:hypothetical protein [Actinomycetota bacterium]